MTPVHYDNKKNYDVIDFIKDYDLNFNEGNVIKYVALNQVFIPSINNNEQITCLLIEQMKQTI